VDRMTATSADAAGSLTLSADAIPETIVALPRLGAERATVLRRRLFTADLVAGLVAGLTAGALASLDGEGVILLAAALGLMWPVLAFLCGLYAAQDLRAWASGAGETPRLALACLGLSWPVFGLLNGLDAPRTVVGALTATAVAAGAASLARAAVRTAVHRSPAFRQRALIVGSGLVATRLTERLRVHDELGLEPVGFIDDHAHESKSLGLQRLGGLDALGPLIDAGRVDRVMIAFSRASHEQLLDCIRVARDRGVAVDVVPRLFEFLDGARTIDQIGGMPLLSINVPHFSRAAKATKRALDLTGATLGLLMLAPVLAVIAIAIKLDSRGGILFKQLRAGRGGRFFTLYKFRSMTSGSSVLVRDDGAIVKRADDQRITRVGRIIRRLSLDEAPQLLNVLRGDMSLVGPRPLVLAEARALTETWQGRRADLRPGLTGPWQVSGRSHIPFQEMVKFDYQYVAGWSLARDVEILIATLPVVISGRGAY
jgi:exopolysaccharide biosynthesis polyprenyl glycosylphosphotransferase